MKKINDINANQSYFQDLLELIKDYPKDFSLDLYILNGKSNNYKIINHSNYEKRLW